MKSILIVTGEASGDLHGATVIRELKKLVGELKVFGIGGNKLESEGVELVSHIKDIAVVGFSEIISKIFHIRQKMKLLYQKMIDERPDLCLLIDYPGFNLRVAKLAQKQGIKVVYYILPQIWAWGRWRVKSIYKWVDKGISILPFEHEFYNYSSKIKFVGHPLLDIIHPQTERVSSSKMIAFLPGSRKEEITRILPVMLKCAEKLSGFEFVIPIATGIDKNWVENFVTSYCNISLHRANKTDANLLNRIKIVNSATYDVLRNVDLALIASGTATLEACMLEVPSIIIYRVSLFSYILARMLIRIPYIGLPNIIAHENVMPEFIQFNAKPTKIVEAVYQILKDRERVIAVLQKAKERLGLPGASARVAQLLYEVLEG